MNKSTEISSAFWNLSQKAIEELDREEIFIDDIIQKSHIEKELLANINNVKTVFDGGAGYGRFSILLAKNGLKVTHFDISLVMIEQAKKIAKEAGVYDSINFIHGSLDDLKQFRNNEFDLVISFDSPISYTYPNQDETINNLIRICSKKIIIGVYCRLAWTYNFDPAQKLKYILKTDTKNPLAQYYLNNGTKILENFIPDIKNINNFMKTGLMEEYNETINRFNNGETPWPVSYAFTPDELVEIMDKNDMNIVKMAGPGALSRSIPGEVLRNIMKNEKIKKDFLDFCYEYDSQKWVIGLGKDNIIINAEKICKNDA